MWEEIIFARIYFSFATVSVLKMGGMLCDFIPRSMKAIWLVWSGTDIIAVYFLFLFLPNLVIVLFAMKSGGGGTVQARDTYMGRVEGVVHNLTFLLSVRLCRSPRSWRWTSWSRASPTSCWETRTTLSTNKASPPLPKYLLPGDKT